MRRPLGGTHIRLLVIGLAAALVLTACSDNSSDTAAPVTCAEIPNGEHIAPSSPQTLSLIHI